ncbi:DUF6283 family protein [Streptomyces sp. NPDC001941]|uniref:DUF6283 family protein n=1 Tax=Streptomyces sp. NPDC001941 TaxID=3154659 RepID=UPI0033341921
MRVHDGSVDHTAYQVRPGSWRMACDVLPVHPDDLARTLTGTPCPGCARALTITADPAAAALRSDIPGVQRRENSGQSPLPGSGPRSATTAAETSLVGADTAHDRRVRASLAVVAAQRGVSLESLLAQLNAAFRSGLSVVPCDEQPVDLPLPARAANVVAHRAADDVWEVVSVAYDGVPKAAARPCGGAEPCPWRRDAPIGQFPATAYELSEPTSRPDSTRRFGCHSSTPASPRMCAGWLLRGADGNAEVQDLLATGRLTRPELPDGVELYDSYAQMAAANGATLDSPAKGSDTTPDPTGSHQDPA